MQETKQIKKKGAWRMEEINAPSGFGDLKHSIHIFSKNGDRIADIDENGVKVYSDEIGVSVCKETSQVEGWKTEKIIFTTENLPELLNRKKIEP